MKYLKVVSSFIIYETETGAVFFMTLMLPTTLYGLAGGTGGGRSCRRNKKMLEKEKEENDVRQEENGKKKNGKKEAVINREDRKINQLLESLLPLQKLKFSQMKERLLVLVFMSEK